MLLRERTTDRPENTLEIYKRRMGMVSLQNIDTAMASSTKSQDLAIAKTVSLEG